MKQPTLALTFRGLAVALGLLVLAAPSAVLPGAAWGQQPSATQRLLELKKQQEGGGATAGAPTAATGAEQAGDAVQIEAEGLASYYANDPARSREEAIEAAQREAVEQASGLIITTESQMRNFDLVSDEVLSRSKGFIRKFDIVKEGQEKVFYKVTISALVVRQAFIDDVNESLENLYRRVGKPRVMLVVEEVDAEAQPAVEGQAAPSTAAALGVLEKEIRKILLKQGFTFIDARALTKGSLVEKAQKGRGGDRETMLDMARTSKAEIVMIGNGRIAPKGRLQKFYIAEASVGLDVIRTDNGQVMASEVSQGKGLHINEDTAAINALKKAAEELTPRIMEQVTYLWIKERNEGRRIEMVVKNVSFGDLLALRKLLGNTLKGVKKVRQKSYSDGVALLELESRDATDRLAESLYETQFDGFKLVIEDVSDTTLTVNMVK